MQTKEQKAAYDKIRYTENREQALAYKKAYCQANPERVAAYAKTYREGNRQKISASNGAYRQANHERYLAYHKARYAADRQNHLAYQKEYAAAHPNECLARNHKQRAKKLGSKIVDTAAILIWLNGWRTPAPVSCHYCKAVAPGTDMQVDHVIPMSKGGDHDLSNLVVCCSKCNKSKGDKLPEVWQKQINP